MGLFQDIAKAPIVPRGCFSKHRTFMAPGCPPPWQFQCTQYDLDPERMSRRLVLILLSIQVNPIGNPSLMISETLSY